MARVITGKVVSASRDKTVTIRVDRRVSHPIYKKQYTKSQKYQVHDEKNQAGVGDTITAHEVRPISKTKNWNLDSVIEKAKVLGSKEA